MFSDIGAVELVLLIVLGVLVFGPDKLPKVAQDASRFVRKVRAFSDSAKQDIRTELGPDFQDFEFEDLNPKSFIRKRLDGHEGFGEFGELRATFDLGKEMNDVADAVNGREAAPTAASATVDGSARDPLRKPESHGRPEHPPCASPDS
ncbi:sec-independent translocase [Streptomyces sp. NPDC094447]|uniref:sec-independent translocase n=1 Tax=Streptomyces sp. NPDC094447 TaxID=3366062 RepID=UPI003801E577